MKKSIPREGYGLHRWLLGESRRMLIEGNKREKVISKLIATVEKMGGRTTQDIETEVTNAVEGAIEWLALHPFAHFRRKLFEVEDELYRDVSNAVCGYDTLAPRGDRRKPWVEEDEKLRRAVFEGDVGELGKNEILKFSHARVFANLDMLICVGEKQDRVEIYPLSRWLQIGLSNYQYVVPSPMISINGGRRDDNTSMEFYQVIEFDHDTLEDQMILLTRLNEEIELGMIVFSGNKSFHGWFPIFNYKVRVVKSFFRLATALGADPHLWVACQYVRMPMGINLKTGKRQKVVYWNDKAIARNNREIRKVYKSGN